MRFVQLSLILVLVFTHRELTRMCRRYCLGRSEHLPAFFYFTNFFLEETNFHLLHSSNFGMISVFLACWTEGEKTFFFSLICRSCLNAGSILEY